MQTEFEIKILDINILNIEQRLKTLGFTPDKDILFKRYVYSVGKKGAWLRLRTDGSKTTLTLKNFVSNTIDGVEETEITVSDFETTHTLLQSLGFTPDNYQENKRRTYVFSDPNVEVSIDEWPQIPPYLEIEAADADTVAALLDAINQEDNPTTSEPTSAVYARAGITLQAIKNLHF